MPKVRITINSKLDSKAIEEIIRAAYEEVGTLSLVQDVKATMPKTALLIGLLKRYASIGETKSDREE